MRLLAGLCTCTISMLVSHLSHTATWSAQWQRWQDSEFSSPVFVENNPIERNEYLFAYDWKGAHRHQFSYAHQPILIRDGDPAHNGYFHRLDYALQYQHQALDIRFRVGVHGSSNMFKHTDFHREALVGTFRLNYVISRAYIGVGLNGDYRFGHFRLYPTLASRWNVAKKVKLEWILPYSMYLGDEQNSWRVGLERYGEKWATLDKEREIESALYVDEWRVHAQWTFERILYDADITLLAGTSINTEIQYVDLVAGRIQEELDDAPYIAIGVARAY